MPGAVHLGGRRPHPGRRPYSGREPHHVAFRVEDLDAATAQLTERGVVLLQPRVTNAPLGRASVLLTDPDGNVVELTEPLG